MAEPEGLFIKIVFPAQGQSKVMKFEGTNTTEEVYTRVSKNALYDTTGYGLFLPPQENVVGSLPSGFWLPPNTELNKHYIVSRQTIIEFKPRESEKTANRKSIRDAYKSSNGNLTGQAPIREEKGVIRNILARFFEARPSQDELIQKKILQQEVHTEHSISLRWDIVERVTQFIETKGINAEGIYRISGLQVDVRRIERSFAHEHFDLVSISNVHNATSALKLYFREMNPPIIPYESFQTWMDTAEIRDERQHLEALRKAFSMLPSLNKRVFEHLCRHLLKVAQQSSQNKMSIQNLAIVVAPTLMRPRIDKDALSIVMENEKKCRILDFVLNNIDAVFQEAPVVVAPPVAVAPVVNTPPKVVTPFPAPVPVEQEDDDFGYFSDIMEMSITGNHIEKVQAAKELAGLFLDDPEGKFEAYLKEIAPSEQLVKVITRMAVTLNYYVK